MDTDLQAVHSRSILSTTMSTDVQLQVILRRLNIICLAYYPMWILWIALALVHSSIFSEMKMWKYPVPYWMCIQGLVYLCRGFFCWHCIQNWPISLNLFCVNKAFDLFSCIVFVFGVIVFWGTDPLPDCYPTSLQWVATGMLMSQSILGGLSLVCHLFVFIYAIVQINYHETHFDQATGYTHAWSKSENRNFCKQLKTQSFSYTTKTNNMGKDDLYKDKSSELQCVICLTNYKEKDTVTRLPCSHLYHLSCITTWMSVRLNCPLCRWFPKPDVYQTQDTSLLLSN